MTVKRGRGRPRLADESNLRPVATRISEALYEWVEREARDEERSVAQWLKRLIEGAREQKEGGR